jgi:hypothetical protein
VDDLGAEVRQLHGLVVGQRIDDLRVGHAARIGRQHAVDVGPDVDLRGIEQRAEDRAGEVAAVAAERGLHAAAVGGDEAGDDQRAGETGGTSAAAARATRPTARRAERTPLDDDDLARVDPAHLAAAAGALLVELAEQARRPDLAEAGDQVDDVARRRTRQPHRVQDALEVVAVTVERGHVEPRGFGRAAGSAIAAWRDAQALEPAPLGGSWPRPGDQRQQRIGDALAGRQHHAEPAGGLGLEDGGDAPEAVGIGDAGAAELVDDPFPARARGEARAR